MPSSPNDRSSDLTTAREASRAVRGIVGPTDRERGYVRFGAPHPESAAAGPAGLDDWDALLVETRSRTRATVAFVVSAEGLVVAHLGDLPVDRIEALGSRSLLAIDELDALDPDTRRARLLVGTLGEGFLVALRSGVDGDERATLGMLVPALPDAATHSALEARITDVIRRRRSG